MENQLSPHETKQDEPRSITQAQETPAGTEAEEYCDVETIEYHGRKIKIVHMEHEDENKPEMASGQASDNIINKVFHETERGGQRPNNWPEIISKEVEGASLVFLEYLPEELDRELTGIPRSVLDQVGYISEDIEDFFSRTATICAQKGVDVAVADIAFKPRWGVADVLDQVKLRAKSTVRQDLRDFNYRGHQEEIDPNIEFKERTATDARRLITAMGIMEEALRRKEGSTIVYIAPPAHAKRVAETIRRDTNPVKRKVDQRRFESYKRRPLFTNLIRTRIYSCPSSQPELDAAVAMWSVLDLPRGNRTLKLSQEEQKARKLVADIYERKKLEDEIKQTEDHQEKEWKQPPKDRLRVSTQEAEFLGKIWWSRPGDIRKAIQMLTARGGWTRVSNMPINQPTH